MKYNPSDYDEPLKEEMEDVERAYMNYKEDEDNEELYWKLKEAVYSLSLVLKQARACRYLTPMVIDEMNEYYWSLLL